MSNTPLMSTCPVKPWRLSPILLALLLTACGGGGDTSGSGGTGSNVSDTTAQAMSADSTLVMDDGAESTTTLVTTTEAVAAVATGSASQTVNCPGGGTARYSVTGASVSAITNGQLDAGEVYTLSFSACRGASGAAALDGSATLTVVAASPGSSVQVQSSTRQLSVTLPQRVLALDGSSQITVSRSTSGSSTTTATRWRADAVMLTSTRQARTSTYSLTGVDVTRSVTTAVGTGVVTATSGTGTATLGAVRPNGAWSMTLTTQGAVGYDSTTGAPTQGAWQITLPYNEISVSAVPGRVTISIDHGANGSIDGTLVLTPETLVAQAG